MLVVDDHTLLTAGLVGAQVLVDAPVAAPATQHAPPAPGGEGVVGDVMQWALQCNNVLEHMKTNRAVEEEAEAGKG